MPPLPLSRLRSLSSSRPIFVVVDLLSAQPWHRYRLKPAQTRFVLVARYHWIHSVPLQDIGMVPRSAPRTPWHSTPTSMSRFAEHRTPPSACHDVESIIFLAIFSTFVHLHSSLLPLHLPSTAHLPFHSFTQHSHHLQQSLSIHHSHSLPIHSQDLPYLHNTSKQPSAYPNHTLWS